MSISPAPSVLPVMTLLAWETPWLNTVDRRTVMAMMALAATKFGPRRPMIMATMVLPKASSESETNTGML